VNVTDDALVRAARAGDREAFAVLYDRFAGLITALCRDQERDPHAARDLAQEVFLRAYQKLADLADPPRFGAWLVGITRLVCLEGQRNGARRTRLMNDVAAGANDAVAEVAAATSEPADDRIDELRDAIAQLPERERLALHAFYMQELDAGQICELLGLSRSGVYFLLSSARQRLASMLRELEVRP
jgi:RNA polymerase sigma-70 factor (ECF subfamily)